MIRAFEGYSLSWAIYVAGAVDITNEPVRQRVIGTLKRNGRLMGYTKRLCLHINWNRSILLCEHSAGIWQRGGILDPVQRAAYTVRQSCAMGYIPAFSQIRYLLNWWRRGCAEIDGLEYTFSKLTFRNSRQAWHQVSRRLIIVGQILH